MINFPQPGGIHFSQISDHGHLSVAFKSRPILSLLHTMGDNFCPVVCNSGPTLLTLGKNSLRSFVRGMHSYFSMQQGGRYVHFEDAMVRSVRQSVL